MRTETLHIGTREEIIHMITSDPARYRHVGELSLDEQLTKIEQTDRKFGAVFMLGGVGDNATPPPANAEQGFRIDKWFIWIKDKTDEPSKSSD